MNTLKERLARLRERASAVKGTPRVAVVVGVLLVASSSVFFYQSDGAGPAALLAAPKVPVHISMTRLVDDAAAGLLAGAVVDESSLTVQATYGPAPTGPTPAAAPAAGYGGALRPGATANAEILTSYLTQVVDTLVRSHVPVRAGVITGNAPAVAGGDPAGDVSTRTATSNWSAGPHSATPRPASVTSDGTVNGRAVVGLLLLSVGALLIIIGLHLHKRRKPAQLDAPAAVLAGPADDAGTRRFGPKKATAPAVEPAAVPDTRFTDVAGCDEAKAELLELVMFLKEPERFTRTGATAPKGALLSGPPGTGKTLLARAVAGEAGVPMFTAAGSDFVEKYVGVGAQRVRALFAAARTHERAIIFIDEVDAVARRRSGDGEASHVESESTLVALLAEMDGFHASNVIVIAATNRADMLDPAITRPGRLDRKVEVPNPDRRGRQQILAVHAAGKPIEPDVNFEALARRTPGFSGAQLSALVNEACSDAVRRNLETVTAECFDHAVATIAMGRARTSALVTEHDREVTAWHEAGHTLAAYLQADADDPVQVTIIPRGPAGGVTWMSGSDDMFLPRRKAHAQLVTALAGRAAEEILLNGEFTQGAASDLAGATELATAMATQYGMTRLGYQVRRGTATAQAVSDVVEELLGHAHAAATNLLGDHKAFLTAVATELLDAETLTLADVHAIATGLGVARHAHVPIPDPPAQVRATKSRPTEISSVARAAAPPVHARAASPRRLRALAGALLHGRTSAPPALADN